MSPRLWFHFDKNGMPESIILPQEIDPSAQYRAGFARSFALWVSDQKCWFFDPSGTLTPDKAQAIAVAAIKSWDALQHIDLRKFSIEISSKK